MPKLGFLKIPQGRRLTYSFMYTQGFKNPNSNFYVVLAKQCHMLANTILDASLIIQQET